VLGVEVFRRLESGGDIVRGIAWNTSFLITLSGVRLIVERSYGGRRGGGGGEVARDCCPVQRSLLMSELSRGLVTMLTMVPRLTPYILHLT
jgi:hypothetical protein